MDINLVLVGDTMLGETNIHNDTVRDYLKKNSSYNGDIYFLGYVDQSSLEWLYEHALAFVYPSTYEGFGLPILEAMRYGTPVVTYSNTSIYEVAGEAALYADGYLGIAEAVTRLLGDSNLRKKYASLSKNRAGNYKWENTATEIVTLLS